MKRFIIALLTVAVVGSISFIGCVGVPPTTETPTYTNLEHSFSVEYPSDWYYEEEWEEALVVFQGPVVRSPVVNVRFRVNVSIKAKNLQFPIPTLEDFYREYEKYIIEEAFEDYRDLDKRNVTISGLPAIVRTRSISQHGHAFLNTQAMFLKEDIAYLVGYTTPPEFHDEYMDCFDLVIYSFRFK